MKQFSSEQKSDLMKQVKKLSKTLSTKEACDKAGLSLSTYYQWNNKKSKPSPNSTKRRYSRKQLFTGKSSSTENSTTDITAVIFRGKSDDVLSLVRNFQQ